MQKLFGVTLIEVLISLLILMLALLGFDAMLLDASQKMRNAYYFTLATDQIISIAEWLHGHTKDQSTDHLQQWNQEIQSFLPAGQGILSDKGSHYQITLFWGQKTHQRICKEDHPSELHCLSVQLKHP